MARRDVSAAVQAAIDRAAVKTPQDKLDRIRRLAKEARGLEAEIGDINETLKEKSKARLEILHRKIPELCLEAQVSVVEVDADGNTPPFQVVVSDFISANIAADWDEKRRTTAFQLLEWLGAGDLIKQVVSISFPMDSRKQQKEFAAAMKKLKIPFDMRVGVPHNSLSAFVKERFEQGKPLSTQQLEILGASVGRAARIKEVKERSAVRRGAAKQKEK